MKKTLMKSQGCKSQIIKQIPLIQIIKSLLILFCSASCICFMIVFGSCTTTTALRIAVYWTDAKEMGEALWFLMQTKVDMALQILGGKVETMMKWILRVIARFSHRRDDQPVCWGVKRDQPFGFCLKRIKVSSTHSHFQWFSDRSQRKIQYYRIQRKSILWKCLSSEECVWFCKQNHLVDKH